MLEIECARGGSIDETIHAPFKAVIEPLLSQKQVMGWKAVGAGAGGCAILLVEPSAQTLSLRLAQRLDGHELNGAMTMMALSSIREVQDHPAMCMHGTP